MSEKKKPKFCWLVPRWCSPYCVAYCEDADEDGGACGILAVAIAFFDKLSSLESAITDLTEVLQKHEGSSRNMRGVADGLGVSIEDEGLSDDRMGYEEESE